MGAHWPTCLWVGATCAAANRVTIATAGGVDAIIQGMQAHVGVAAVQEDGAGALTHLAKNGALSHRLCCRCVVHAWLRLVGVRCLFASHHLPRASV